LFRRSAMMPASATEAGLDAPHIRFDAVVSPLMPIPKALAA